MKGRQEVDKATLTFTQLSVLQRIGALEQKRYNASFFSPVEKKAHFLKKLFTPFAHFFLILHQRCAYEKSICRYSFSYTTIVRFMTVRFLTVSIIDKLHIVYT
jgi:hypothetical protein